MAKEDAFPYYEEHPVAEKLFGRRFDKTLSLKGYELRDRHIYLKEFSVPVAKIEYDNRAFNGTKYISFELYLSNEVRDYRRGKPEFRSIYPDVFFSRMKEVLLTEAHAQAVVKRRASDGASCVRTLSEVISTGVAQQNMVIKEGRRIMMAYLNNERDPELLDQIREYLAVEQEVAEMARIDMQNTYALVEAHPVVGHPQWYRGAVNPYTDVLEVALVEPPTSERLIEMMGMLKLQLSDTNSRFTSGDKRTAVADGAGIHVRGRFTTYVIPSGIV